MSPTPSARTVRLRGIDRATTSLDDFQNVAIRLSEAGSSRRRFFSSSTASIAESAQPLSKSLAIQNEHFTGTVSFPSVESKRKAITVKNTGGWVLDDKFDSLTILYAPDTADLDICAVHGLGGNAFDTWMATSKMWLRDLLPGSAPFERSRIMTFGYNSTLVDKKSNDRLRDWADELLRQVGYVRSSAEEQERPIVFICHSMGGLVGREAMVRLNTVPNKFDGVKLEHCGLLFLSTPHSGTTQADWNDFLVNLAELTIGVRSHEIVDQLRSFNPASVDSEESFAVMRKIPPFYCLVEGDKTKIAGRDRNIVTQASGGFHGLTADKILNVDHSGVCKFDTKFGGYMLVLDRLKKIRAELFSMGVGAAVNSQNIPGRPKVTAPRYPLASNTKFYEGSDLRAASQLVGRTEALQEIMSLLTIDGPPIPKMIALTGIGGVGKTELLLELALRYRNQRNVFFIHANDLESLEHAFLDIATSIGHDLLASRGSYPDLHAVWRGLEPPDRVRAFKSWLGDPDNQPSLFIVDDLDGLRTDMAIKAALPREALVVLYSTRDPSIIGGLRRNCQEFRVPTMDIDEMAALMDTILHQSGSTFSQATLSEVELESVARVVDGNALAGCRAISYIVQVLAQTAETRPAHIFLDVFNGSDWRARKQFLHYKPRFGLSIMETFETSLQRLRRHQIAARRLVQLIAFLSSPDHSLDFRKFLSIERPWLLEFRASLPDYDVFATGLTGQGEYLAELENVSLGFRSIPNGPLQLHPLWTECIHQRAEHEGRVLWLRQILLVCFGSWTRDEVMDRINPFVQNCLQVAARFQIDLDELAQNATVRHWIEQRAETGAQVSEQSAYSPVITQEPYPIRLTVLALRDSCAEASQIFHQVGAVDATEESYAKALRRLLPLLAQLRRLEDAHEDLHQDYVTAQLHLEIYDILIPIATLFKRRNPMLGQQLRGRKRDISTNLETDDCLQGG